MNARRQRTRGPGRGRMRSRSGLLRRLKGRAGFTLIEMLAVIAILGVLMTVAVLGFNNFGRGVRLRTAARLIQQHLDGARELAMTHQCMYRVQLQPRVDPDRDRLRIYYMDTTTGNPVTHGKWQELPESIEFGQYGTTFSGLEIAFKPTGSADNTYEFKINDRDSSPDSPRQCTIKVIAITGHSEVVNE